MDLGLRGKRAIVLASSMGLGRAAAEALAAEGVQLAISSSNPQRCRETAHLIAQIHGTRAVPIVADMFVPESMDALFRAGGRCAGRHRHSFHQPSGTRARSGEGNRSRCPRAAVQDDGRKPDPSHFARASGDARAQVGPHRVERRRRDGGPSPTR